METGTRKRRTRKRRPELVLRQGPQPGQRLPLNKPAMTIGREAGNDIVIGDAEVSRRHASLTWDGSHWIIEDLGSANGTVVNGARITGPRVLSSGDTIGLSRTVTFGLETPALAHVPGPPDPQTLVSAYPGPAQPRRSENPRSSATVAASTLGRTRPRAAAKSTSEIWAAAGSRWSAAYPA